MASDRNWIPHAENIEASYQEYQTSLHGLSVEEAESRLRQYGRNRFPESRPAGITILFIRQFYSPLIYVLLAAAILSIVIQEWSDALFIGAVLLINAIIGTFQEYSAQRAVSALKGLVTTQCQVMRTGDSYLIDAEELVVGDILLVSSGDRIPADVRLIGGHDLEVDESLLTGESKAVHKDPEQVMDPDTGLADRLNMLFAGSMVGRGRGRGIVVATALNTELGHIAEAVLNKPPAKAPLLIRMEKFTHKVAILVGLAALMMAMVTFYQGMPLTEIFLLVVALAVSVIPEGLPVALTVALAIGMRRMAKQNVIVRRLVAVEALGSCTFIATDKTGTLTVNQLTVKKIQSPEQKQWKVIGSGLEPKGAILPISDDQSASDNHYLQRVCRTAVFCNEAVLGHKAGGWVHQGDAVDVSLLLMAHKQGITRAEMISEYEELALIPFESERLFSASLNQAPDHQLISVKGALERLLPMCSLMANGDQDIPIDKDLLNQQAVKLASQGYRVLALATGRVDHDISHAFDEHQLQGLTLLALVGMIDPLRPEAKAAISSCRNAGIEVAMITGDHPETAMAIARELDLVTSGEAIVTGRQLKAAESRAELDALTRHARVFARIEPQQKLDIVESLQRHGHFVAVSGDGANDAPALRAAQVGVAMGKSGTDVARETAELVITDDDFSSMVKGVEEGRLAYANVRNVIFLLISTGMAELVLFTLALITGFPLPLVAVQLLWLNLVTNGIQHIALAFEPANGDELNRPPRSPQDPIFNRIMIERVVIAALVMGFVAFYVVQWLLNQGYSVDQARNGTLLLMVLFENIHVFNCRSETRSVFGHNPLRNRILLFGTLAAQLIHIGAMYTPWIKDVLHIEPVTAGQWLELLFLAFSVMVVMELHKLYRSLTKSA